MTEDDMHEASNIMGNPARIDSFMGNPAIASVSVESTRDPSLSTHNPSLIGSVVTGKEMGKEMRL